MKKRVTVSLCFSTQKEEMKIFILFFIYNFFYPLEVTQVTQRGYRVLEGLTLPYIM